MPRPRYRRLIRGLPRATYFKPSGIPMRVLDEIVVTLDELESLRLADLEGLYQEAAAERMGISRPTFSRLVESARRKVAGALVHGKALRIEGGDFVVRGAGAMPTGRGPGFRRGRGGCGRRQGFGARRGG